jgi:PheRS DNA binding domain 1
MRHQKVVGGLKSIESHGELLNFEKTSRKTWQVTDEGRYVIEHGSHEACVYNAVPDDGGISQPDLMKSCNFHLVKFRHPFSRHHQTLKLASARQCRRVGLLSISRAVLQSSAEKFLPLMMWCKVTDRAFKWQGRKHS